MVFVTSDLHFFHDRKFIYEPRGFSSVEEMNNAYIEEWLSRVTDEDDVYVVGDFCLGNDYDLIDELIDKLPGNIHLLIGNHDTLKKIKCYESRGIDVKYADVITYKKRRYYLSHYPTITANLNSHPSNCVINLHGHLHVKDIFYDDKPFMINVSVDANDNKFLTLDDIKTLYDAEVRKCEYFL